MKNQLVNFFGTLILLFSFCSPCLSQIKPQPENFSYSIAEDHRTVETRNSEKIIKTCKIDSAADRAALSFDRKTLLISGNGYITTESINNCGDEAIRTKYTPSENGYLVDFNSSKNRYIALDFVALKPLS